MRSLRTLAELEQLVEAWERFAPAEITADPDVYLSDLRADTEGARPYAVVVERRGRPVALVLARAETLRLPLRLGYSRLRSPRLRAIVTAYGGVLGELDEDVCEAIAGELNGELAARRADVVVLRHLEVGSPLQRIVARRAARRVHLRVEHPQEHWELDLPASQEAFLEGLSAGTRANVVRYRRKLERELGDRVSLAVYRDPEDSEAMFEAVDAVATRTWQHGLGVSFHDSPRYRERARAALSRGAFRAYVLCVDGIPCAFEQGFVYRRRFVAGRPGYDVAYRGYQPGTYLLVTVIGELCRDPDVDVLDFGVGDADYKRRIASRFREESDVLLYGRTPRALAVLWSRAVLGGVTRAGDGLLRRLGLRDRLKRRWRRRLGARARTPAGGRGG